MSAKTKGISKLMKNIKSLQATQENVAQVGVFNQRKETYTKNMRVLLIQIAHGRDPLAIEKDAMKYAKVWKDYVERFIRGKKVALKDGAKEIAKKMIGLIHRRIDLAKGFEPNKKYYDNIKKAKRGHTKQLVNTGQLYASFYPGYRKK